MRYYVDTEFNGSMTGQLISIGIVSASGREFYAVLPMLQAPEPWITANVLPVLNRIPESRHDTSYRLREFLSGESERIAFISDWPEDLQHLNSLLILRPLERMRPSTYACAVIDAPEFSGSAASALPHNSLCDARALRDYVEQQLALPEGGGLTSADYALLSIL